MVTVTGPDPPPLPFLPAPTFHETRLTCGQANQACLAASIGWGVQEQIKCGCAHWCVLLHKNVQSYLKRPPLAAWRVPQRQSENLLLQASTGTRLKTLH